jgi:hypothetical protein
MRGINLKRPGTFGLLEHYGCSGELFANHKFLHKMSKGRETPLRNGAGATRW